MSVQVTNQIIMSCKSYISNGGADTIWSLEPERLLSKLSHCLQLYDSYRVAYRETKDQLDNDDEDRKFDFSETLIFGKFDRLSRRLKKIVDMFEMFRVYGRIRDQIGEGMPSN